MYVEDLGDLRDNAMIDASIFGRNEKQFRTKIWDFWCFFQRSCFLSPKILMSSQKSIFQ